MIRQQWLLGSNGLFWGSPERAWTPFGEYRYRITAIRRVNGCIVAGTNAGLWEIREESKRWRQLHDETLTEVHAILPGRGDPGIYVASSYGLMSAERDSLGACRWTSHSEGCGLNPSERFSLSLLHLDAEHILVGTEAGALVWESSRRRWERTALMGTAVRALLHHDGTFWAGTDCGGMWISSDGYSWTRAGLSPAGSVFDLKAHADGFIAGLENGIGVSVDGKSWCPAGPNVLFSGVDIGPEGDWLAGGMPGGLWHSQDHGTTWRNIPGWEYVPVVLAPEGAAR